MHDILMMEAEGFSFVKFIVAVFMLGVAGMLGFLAYAASRPVDNPLRQVAGILAMRAGITAGIGIVDIPVTVAAPPLGGAMDVVSFVALAGYWIVGFWKMGKAFMPPKPGVTAAPPAPPTIVYMQPPQQQGHALMPLPSFERQTYAPAPPPYPAE